MMDEGNHLINETTMRKYYSCYAEQKNHDYSKNNKKKVFFNVKLFGRKKIEILQSSLPNVSTLKIWAFYLIMSVFI